MNKFIGIFLGLFVALGIMSAAAKAGGLPIVISATVDYTRGTVTLDGQNFGTNPVVTLGNEFRDTMFLEQLVIANFAAGMQPATFLPSTYFRR